jgi:hypothetical protein
LGFALACSHHLGFYLNTNISETIQQNSIFFFAMIFVIYFLKYKFKKINSRFSQNFVRKIYSQKNYGKFTIKKVFLSLKNSSNYFLSKINQVDISNFIEKNHLHSEKIKKLDPLMD